MILLLLLEGFSSMAGFSGGLLLIIAPSGALMSLPLSLLSSLPVHLTDFLLVGVWLFTAFGVGFAIVTYLLWSKKPYAWTPALILSLVWIAQMTSEMIFLGPNILSEVYYIPQVAALILLVAGRYKTVQLRL